MASLTQEERAALNYAWSFWGRPNQLTPEKQAAAGDWTTWLVMAGRGFGKTRMGAEETIRQVKAGRKRIALVGATAADVRDVMVLGESGIMACSAPWFRPVYTPSKRLLTWPNGAIATTYSADSPDRLRGPQHEFAWSDELAAWQYPDAWDQLQMGLRLGNKPQVIVTTTPRPTAIIRKLLAEATTALTRGSTYDNARNLAQTFLTQILARYEGTRLGRQELLAEILDDTPGALWKRDLIDLYRVMVQPELRRIVVAIDPAASAGESADETGIIACGKSADGDGYVLADRSVRDSPAAWARRAIDCYIEYKADAIVAEVNNGGDMVEHTIRSVLNPGEQIPRIIKVHASRSKQARAEPFSALYEKGRVHHVGSLPMLEDQMATWIPGDEKSPDRIDALVWGLTELGISFGEITSKDVDIW